MLEPMAVSVIISNFNGAKYLPRLLQTLHDQRDVQIEIIIVDRNSTDESHAILYQHHEVTVVNEPPETGLVSGYDTGAKHARYQHLFFCNEDMWFAPDCLALLENALDVRSGVWAADPWQWTYDGSTWIHGGTRFQKTARLQPIYPHPFQNINFTVPLSAGDIVPFGCAGAIMMDRDVYHKIGGWDRGFFLDREDLDIFFRAWLHSWSCVCVPAAKVYHAVNASNAKAINGGKLKVGKRRYISGCSSQLIMSAKYFPLHWIVTHLVLYIGWSLFHLLTFRVQQFSWEMLAMKEFWKRLPKALDFRRSAIGLLQSKPAPKFFTDPAFQV